MSKAIKTYDDLLHEEQRLKAQLESYKIIIAEDIEGIKAGLNPVKRAVDIGKKIFTRDDNGPLLNFGLNFGIDVLMKRLLLARAGWIFKILVPYVVKNYASHIISDDDRGKIAKAIRKWMKKLNTRKAETDFETEVGLS